MMLVPIHEIFDIWYGVNLELQNCDIAENTDNAVPFVSRTSQNNGISAYVYEIEGQEKNPKNSISVAGSGSVLASFYHPYEYYSGRDTYILSPKVDLTEKEMLYYCAAIEANQYRYNYGRQANKTLKNIKVPSPVSIPKIISDHQLKEKINIENNISILPLFLSTEAWKFFYLRELFDFNRGNRLVAEDRIDGDIPLVTAGADRQGVKTFISNEEQPVYKNRISVDMFGNAFYHDYLFCCDDNILALKPKLSLNAYTMIFVATIINGDSYKYQYGRQYRIKNFNTHRIKLPVTSTGIPDWDFMEQFIKSLPYSSNL